VHLGTFARFAALDPPRYRRADIRKPWCFRDYSSRIVQKNKNRLSSGGGPVLVAEHSAEALSALNRVMG